MMVLNLSMWDPTRERPFLFFDACMEDLCGLYCLEFLMWALDVGAFSVSTQQDSAMIAILV